MNNRLVSFAFAIFLLLPFAGRSQTVREALSKGDTVEAIKLIRAGEDINAVDRFGSTMLMNACRWANDTQVSFLLRHGATPDKPRSPKGRTCLIVAGAYYAGKTICNMLLDYGADVNAVADDGTTALMLAAQSAKLDVVELLLKRGANKALKDRSGKSALDYANSAVIEEYLKKSVKDTRIDKDAVINLLSK